MKQLIFVLLFAVLTLFSSLAFAGTAFYVDCSAGSDGNGSYASPWNNIASVNNHSFNTGDDVYFKVNTTCTPDAEFIIDWDGTEGDRVIIGAYYGNGQFGLNGNSRPIIDGQHTVPAGPYGALIRASATELSGYMTVQDLHLHKSNTAAIVMKYVDNIIVDNCYTYQSVQQGIIFVRVDTGTISNNVVEEASYAAAPLKSTGKGAAIALTSMDIEGATTNVVVSGNKVFHGHEAIGLYKMVTNCTVEHNHVYDNDSYQIYIDAGYNNTIRYNFVYGSVDWADWGYGPYAAPAAIVVNCEQQRVNQYPDRYPYGGSNKIYGNLIAFTNDGIVLYDQAEGFAHTNEKIYNNTIVDCRWSIRIGDNSGWSGNEIKNNISWTITKGDSWHLGGESGKSGITWSHNNFDDPVSANAANNAKIYDPQLTKISGWRFIQPGSAKGSYWSLQEGSQNKDNGVSISGYDARIYYTNIAGDPIEVKASVDSTPDIGAWTLTEWNANLRIVP